MTAAVAVQFKSCNPAQGGLDDLCPAESRGRVVVCNVSSRPATAQHVRPPVTRGRAKKKALGKSALTAPAVTGIFLLVSFARRSDFAEETVTLILNACGEEELVGVSCHKTIAEGQSPKAVNGDGIALTTAKLTVERVALELEASAVTVAEIAHEQVAGELSEVVWSQRQDPGRVERAARGKPLKEATVEVEDIDKAAAWALDVVVSLGVLHGKGDIQLAIDVPNAERSETRVRRVRRNRGVGERTYELNPHRHMVLGIAALSMVRCSRGTVLPSFWVAKRQVS